jgi:hypothetical protein
MKLLAAIKLARKSVSVLKPAAGFHNDYNK